MLKDPLRVVSIGGGTGLSTLLSGLKVYARGAQGITTPDRPVVDITAVVTVTDDGGSSGRLRRDFDILHVAPVGAGGIVEAMLLVGRVPMRSGTREVRAFAPADAVNVNSMDSVRKARRLDVEGDAARRLPGADASDCLAARIDQRHGRTALRLGHRAAGGESGRGHENAEFAHLSLFSHHPGLDPGSAFPST